MNAGLELPEIRTAVPGPRSNEMAGRLRQVESSDATWVGEHFPIFWSRAAGSNVWDVDDNRYIDLVAGFGVAALGHGHPRVLEALRNGEASLIHGMGDVHPTEIRLRLSERLQSIAPGPGPWKAIYGLNGSDAVEAALKTVARASDRPRLLSFDGGYHGTSLGALTITAGGYFREGIEPLLGAASVKFPYPGFLDETPEEGRLLLKEIQEFLDSEKGEDIGGVIIEPLAGRGGCVRPPKNFLSGLRKLCDRNKLILIFDEIFTGMGRTGRWFACEHEGVAPDLLLIGKALGGGLPLSVCLGAADVIDEAWPETQGEAHHTATFTGHPLACAAALAVMDAIEQDELLLAVQSKGRALLARLEERLSGLPPIGAIRGLGLMLGIEILHPETGEPDSTGAWSLIEQALKRGLILLVSGVDGNILQWTPSYLIGESQIEFAVDTLGTLLSAQS